MDCKFLDLSYILYYATNLYPIRICIFRILKNMKNYKHPSTAKNNKNFYS